MKMEKRTSREYIRTHMDVGYTRTSHERNTRTGEEEPSRPSSMDNSIQRVAVDLQ
jgi:hypothetical protein